MTWEGNHNFTEAEAIEDFWNEDATRDRRLAWRIAIGLCVVFWLAVGVGFYLTLGGA